MKVSERFKRNHSILYLPEEFRNLEKILLNYSDILTEFKIKEQILEAFKFKKPITSIEIESEDTEKVMQLMEELEDFFYVGYIYFEPETQEFGFSGIIIISRFRNLYDIAITYTKKHKGLLDEFADLSGILFGYSSEEVAEYCLKERLKKFNLIK